MDLKLTEHVRNTISLLHKQKTNKQTNKQTNKKTKTKNKNKQTNKQTKTGEIQIFETFLAKKSILAYISLKIGIFRSAIMLYYVIVTAYFDRFS